MADVRLIIERLLSEEELSKCANKEDLLVAARFGSSRRRAEVLAWRRIVRRELGEDVRLSYSSVGAPVVENEDINIGISHSRDAVVVIISPRRCAADIEPLSRDFSKAAPRFISDAERQLSDDRRLAAALWCAKETLYKYSDRRGLDLLRDIRIESVDFENGRIVGRICDGDPTEMGMVFEYGNMIVYVG